MSNRGSTVLVKEKKNGGSSVKKIVKKEKVDENSRSGCRYIAETILMNHSI